MACSAKMDDQIWSLKYCSHAHSWYYYLRGQLTSRATIIYTGQHKNTMKADKHKCLE
jgi:hypothetical protein